MSRANIYIFLLVAFCHSISAEKCFAQNSKAAERISISNYWTSFSQKIEVNVDERRKFKLSGWVKVESDDDNASAGLWARVDEKNYGGTGFFDNMDDRKIKDEKWSNYHIEGYIDETSEFLVFGGLVSYNGKFFFDNIELSIENENGILEAIKIMNPDFENLRKDTDLVGWKEGISKGNNTTVKEFDISLTRDKVKGDYALLVEGSGTKKRDLTLEPSNEFTPQIGVLVKMLSDLSYRVEKAVQGLDNYKTDYLLDQQANRIGALVMHLAAAEKAYQVLTFEGRSFNEKEEQQWNVAMGLGKDAREKLVGQPISYYLDLYKEVRKETIEKFKELDDSWLFEPNLGYAQYEDLKISNYYSWFHVMEHQSSHLGQILMMLKRIPPKPEISNPKNIKQ